MRPEASNPVREILPGAGHAGVLAVVLRVPPARWTVVGRVCGVSHPAAGVCGGRCHVVANELQVVTALNPGGSAHNMHSGIWAQSLAGVAVPAEA